MFYASDNKSFQSEDDVLKGCHLTWEELKNIEKTILTREEKILSVRHLDFETLPIYFVSIKNLYGYILYKLDEVEESIDIFKEVLEKDPANLNAVNNLVVIHMQLGKLRVANKYKQNVETIIKNAEQQSPYPRAFCEKAHAVRHFQQDCRDFTYMPYLCQAIEFGAHISNPERAEWLFDYSLSLFRKDYQLLLANASSEEKEPNFEEAIHSFYDVILVENGSIVYKALSWVFMGILLRHDQTRSLRRCFPNHRAIHELTSIDCIEIGLDLSPENEIVMRRVASELSLVGRHEMAAELFTKSLAKEKSWFAFRHQGLMYLRMYEAGENDKDLLPKAEESFKQAIEMKDVHADHSDLGYVYFLQGPSHWNKALKRFHCAKSNAHNDNFDITETHRRWAECLEACGEHESASLHLEQAADMKRNFQRMIEKIRTRDQKHGANCDGNECELERFKYCHQEREGYTNVLFENDTPCKSKIRMTQEDTRKPFRYDFFVSFCHIDHKWAIALLKKLEKDFNLNGCLRYRDYRLGISKMDNIIKSIETSHKTIIILSPDSLKDKWCQFEITRAVLENIDRDEDRKCIVPLMLRTCHGPKQLRGLCSLKCERGQIHDNDWVRLGKELKQDNLCSDSSR